MALTLDDFLVQVKKDVELFESFCCAQRAQYQVENKMSILNKVTVAINAIKKHINKTPYEDSPVIIDDEGNLAIKFDSIEVMQLPEGVDVMFRWRGEAVHNIKVDRCNFSMGDTLKLTDMQGKFTFTLKNI